MTDQQRERYRHRVLRIAGAKVRYAQNRNAPRDTLAPNGETMTAKTYNDALRAKLRADGSTAEQVADRMLQGSGLALVPVPRPIVIIPTSAYDNWGIRQLRHLDFKP